MKDVTYFTKGRKFAPIEVCFKTVERARELSDKTLKTEDVIPLSSYIGDARPTLGSRIFHLSPTSEQNYN